MKKIILSTFIFLFVAGGVFAANEQKGIHESGTGIDNSEVNVEIKIQDQANKQNQVNEQIQTDEDVQNSIQTQNKVKNTGESSNLRERIELNLNAQENGNAIKNQLRTNIQNLLIVSDSVDSTLGNQISNIANQFNNSIEKTIQAENKINNRNGITKFFLGGDKEAAEEINVQIEENNENLEQLKNIINTCNCTSDVKEIIQEQVQQIEQEQVRLQDFSQGQINSNGAFGWIINLFK